MDLAEKVNRLMEGKGFNTHSLAARAGVKQPQVHRIVTGKTLFFAYLQRVANNFLSDFFQKRRFYT